MAEGDSPDPRWQQIYDRLVERARELLDDAPALQRVIDVADVRAEGFRELRDNLAPLRRLVISYRKGSYREAPFTDVCQAVAAISYVAMPIDLILDTMPAGLKDDAKVVEFVKDKLNDSLAAYAAWERSLDPPASTQSQVLEAITVTPASEMEVSFLEPSESALASALSGDGPPPVAVQQIAQSSRAVADALQSGKVVRVLGPKHLLKGLEKRTLELVPTETGKLGTVRGASSKRFAGQLRLGEGGAAQTAKLTVSAGFAVASAVTMQYYLASIDAKLGSIRYGLEGLQSDFLDEQLGTIDSARDACFQLREVFERTGRLSSGDLARLVHADSDIDRAFHAIAHSLERFLANAEAITGNLEATDKGKFADFLTEAARKRIPQVRMLIYAAAVRDAVNALGVVVAAQDGDERICVAEETREREQGEMTESIRKALDAIETAHVPKRRLDETWPHLGGPEKELAEFVAASAQLRGLGLTEASESAIKGAAQPARALPEPDKPVLTELWMQDGSLRAERAEVRQVA